MSENIKIGSKIIEGGTAYEVFKIKNTKNGNGTQRIVFYKPCFDNSNSSDIVCSIPEHNITPPDMRKPVSKKEMEEVFVFLSKKTTSNAEVDIMKSKDVFRLNDIFKTAEVLRDVFKEKMLKGEEFSKSKRDLMDASVGKMVEEIALVYRVSLEGAKKKLFVALDGNSK
jgi:RNA polymerase-interacting CarD/CdnL/TRCF family regulator